MDQRVAVLITSHNRREKTLACLRSLESQEGDADLRIYLVDDGSTDGTGDAVRDDHPEVRLLHGPGDLYWSGGMRMADEAADEAARDFTLWINDDVELRPDALARMTETFGAIRRDRDVEPVVVGAFADPDSGETTYTGFRPDGRVRRLRFRPIEPQDHPVRCVTMNGNAVLIPESVRARIGSIDPRYTHGMGDFDYGLRATAAGEEIWLAPGHVGFCRQNEVVGTFRDTALTGGERLRNALSVKQLPAPEWRHFAQRHGGPWWPLLWASPYVRALVRPRRPARKT